MNLIVEGVAGDDSAVFFLSFTLELPELIDRPKRFVRLRTGRAVLPGAAIARRLNMHDPFLIYRTPPFVLRQGARKPALQKWLKSGALFLEVKLLTV